MGKFRKTLADSNSDDVKTTLKLYVISKYLFLFSSSPKLPFLCHFVIYNKGYCKWLCRLKITSATKLCFTTK